MSHHILLSCDEIYYREWTMNCARSIQHHVPWMQITINLVNTTDAVEKIPGIRYHHTEIDFSGFRSPVAYYQASRFLVADELFKDTDHVMLLDCDTVCTRSFSPEEFVEICSRVSVLWNQKSGRWLAGLVTLGANLDFIKEYKRHLLLADPSRWSYGYDQDALKNLAQQFNFSPVTFGQWISLGKGPGIFLTLKGSQKQKSKYLNLFQQKSQFI